MYCNISHNDIYMILSSSHMDTSLWYILKTGIPFISQYIIVLILSPVSDVGADESRMRHVGSWDCEVEGVEIRIMLPNLRNCFFMRQLWQSRWK